MGFEPWTLGLSDTRITITPQRQLQHILENQYSICIIVFFCIVFLFLHMIQLLQFIFQQIMEGSFSKETQGL